MRRTVLPVALAALVVAVVAGAVSAFLASGDPMRGSTPWVATDLGRGVGGSSEAVAINERGQVAGNSYGKGAPTYTPDRAILWEDGKATDLGTGGGKGMTEVAAINDRGQVVGDDAAIVGGRFRLGLALLWEAGDLTRLGVIGGRALERASVPSAVNDHGQVVGLTSTGTGYRPFLWQEERMTDLGSFGGAGASEANAINERGQVVGTSADRSGNVRAFLWQNGRMRDLGALGGGHQSYAFAINERGEVVGVGTRKPGVVHAFVWRNGKMTDLGTLPGGTSSAAVAINERGQIVGWSTTENGARHAVLWQGKRMTDLGALGAENSAAVAINEHGLIIVNSQESADVLWTLRPSGIGYRRSVRDSGLETTSRASVWHNGKLTPLSAPLPGEWSSAALAINDHNQIVGWATKNGQHHAFLWTLRHGT